MNDFSKYLCIFGGGAVRGYAYLGVLRAFAEVGFYPQKYAGSSVGAVFATFCALDIPLKEMEKIFVDINFELFRDINFNFAPAFSISKGGVFLDWLRKIIEKNYYKEDYQKGKNPPVCFKDLDKDLILISTDLTNATPFIFSKETTPDYEVAMAIRASASMPGLMTPVQYEDKLLADGDLMKSSPIWRLDKTLCPDDLRILELRLEGVKRDNNIKNLFDYLNMIYSCMTNYSTDYIIDMYSQKDKFDYIKIDTKDLLLANFNINNETKNEIINLGYNATMEFFEKTLPEKRKFLTEKYSILLEKMQAVDKNIQKNNIKMAKSSLDETFALLVDVKKHIDTKLSNEIKQFKNLFIENLECGFFGNQKLKNKQKIKEQSENIINELMLKCNMG